MKKLVPALLGCAVGLIVIAAFFTERLYLKDIREELLTLAQILAAFAYILGGINLVQVNLPKIRRRSEDWGYKLVMLAGAAVMFSVGLKWQNVGQNPEPGTVQIDAQAAGAPAGRALIRVNAGRTGAVAILDGGDPVAATQDGRPLEVEVAEGKHSIQVSMPLPVAGYLRLEKDFELRAGEVAIVDAPLPMLYGPEGRPYTWLYNYVFAPCNSTMFALLAFFIASAGFRAFRARNTEAALLLGAAIIVLLGRAPIGAYLSEWLPDWTNWIIDIPNNAGRRAIIMGAALGAIGTGLRIVLGIERSHLGSD